MSTKTLIIKSLTRNPQTGQDDEIRFTTGVNFLVGRPNTGKSKWLAMLDYLLGDPGKPEEAFGADLAEKYDSISGVLSIDGEDFSVERKWKQKGTKTKVFVEGTPMPAEEFQEFLSQRLGIPVVHFPKGNPLDEKKWPLLSFRYLLRHIYRQQRFWSDIADKQTESEQLACIFQFFDVAKHLFSETRGELVNLRKNLLKLEGGKEQFLKILDRIFQEISDEAESKTILTADSINAIINKHNLEIERLQKQRDQELVALQNKVMQGSSEQRKQFEAASTRWAKLRGQKEELEAALERDESRMQELSDYNQSIENEIRKMERAQTAGSVFSSLRVTSCPVCDQPIKPTTTQDGLCYLCGQPSEIDEDDQKERIAVEIVRLKEERSEALDLISRLSEERDRMRKVLREVLENAETIEGQLNTVQQAAAMILSPEISIIDMEIGRLRERIRQLSRIKSALEYQAILSDEIDQTRAKIEILKSEVDVEASKVRFTSLGDLLADGMNTYLASLVSDSGPMWQQGRVSVSLKERGFDILVNGEKWTSKLGGTMVLYFLLSYHYAFLRLSPRSEFNYPGLVILDLPPNLEDDSTIRDKENFIAEPYIALVQQKTMKNTQVIIAGAAFEGMEQNNRIILNTVWK
jgi:uncharacterized Zn finger protein (UPF0148 family)